MFKANDSWLCPQHSSWQPSNLKFMSTPQWSQQPDCLPACTNPGTCNCSACMALPSFAVPGMPCLKTTEQPNEAYGLLPGLPHFQTLLPTPNPPYLEEHFQTLLPTPNMYLGGKQSAFSSGLGGKAAAPNADSGSFPKRFLIFDQCGNQTRLIYNSVCPPVQNPTTVTAKFNCGYNLDEEKQAARMDEIDPISYILHEESGENNIIREESEMHEDTEEINALLYSDDDYDDDDDDDYGGDDDDDDEVASTGHSPVGIKGSYEKHDHLEEITEEVASPDGRPNKRQKLLDDGYKKSSPMNTASSVKLDRSPEFNSDAESGFAIGHSEGEEVGSTLAKMQLKKDNIRETLRILEGIIPGAKGKDPLLVIDEAIDYLKILKHQAKTLGVSHQ